MTTLTVQSMSGEQYQFSVGMLGSVRSLKEKLSVESGIHVEEITLLFDAAVLEDEASLRCCFEDCDEPEVILVRSTPVGTRALMWWYDGWVQAFEATRGGCEITDPLPWIKLGDSLHSLGEYQTSWNAYRQAAQIAQGFKKDVSDDELLEDPVVGRWARVLDRAYRRHNWRKFDTEQILELLRLLAADGRAEEVASRQWVMFLPNCFSVVTTWLLARGVPDQYLYHYQSFQVAGRHLGHLGFQVTGRRNLVAGKANELIAEGVGGGCVSVRLYTTKSGVTADVRVRPSPTHAPVFAAAAPDAAKPRKPKSKRRQQQRPELNIWGRNEDWGSDWGSDECDEAYAD